MHGYIEYMITVSVRKKNIICNFRGTDSFTEIVEVLKNNRCTFNPTQKDWTIPLFKYDRVIEELQDFDILEISQFDENALQALRDGDSELEKSPTRIIFDPSLLRYPPLKGKPPFEDYQKLDITRAINRNRYGLFLEMGLGKAYISAAIIAHLRHHNKAQKVLLVSSNIGAANMVHELLKFLYIDPSEIICMTKVKKDRELFKSDKKIVITNYNTFRHICDYYYDKKHPRKVEKVTGKNGKVREKKLKRPDYEAAVLPLKEWLEGQEGILLLDESHALANPKSEQTKRMMSHLDFFKYRYLFSGTPADKNEKLFTLCKVLDNALVHSLGYTAWTQEYNNTGNMFSKYAINPDGWKYDKIKALNERLMKDYAVFRKAADCLEIPKNYIKKVYLEMDPEVHRFIYEAFVKSTLERVQHRKGGMLTRDVLNTFPYLQMALDNPELLTKKHADLLTPELQSAVDVFDFEEDHVKVDTLKDILSEHVGELDERGIVWIWHPDTAYKLAKILKDYNPLVIIGETEDDFRPEILETFRNDKSHKILIASIPVLNTSVTLVEAKFQVYFERVYNYSQFTQSIARISRYGQDQETRTYILIYDNTIDVVLDINLSHKDVLNNKLLSKEFLTQNEWKAIFNCTETTDWGFSDFG
jgi:SNF2 family DNA or RNA helicase